MNLDQDAIRSDTRSGNIVDLQDLWASVGFCKNSFQKKAALSSQPSAKETSSSDCIWSWDYAKAKKTSGPDKSQLPIASCSTILMLKLPTWTLINWKPFLKSPATQVFRGRR